MRQILTWTDDLDFGAQENLYGLCYSQRDAQKALRSIVDQTSCACRGWQLYDDEYGRMKYGKAWAKTFTFGG